jgi:hypothetical protein
MADGHPSAVTDFCNNICQQQTFVSSCISDPAAHARPDEAAPGTPRADHLLLASSFSGSAHPVIWYSSLADLTTRIDPYSVVIGLARRPEFQSKFACPLEGLRRITRRERHGSGYVRKASASRGGKHRGNHRGLIRCLRCWRTGGPRYVYRNYSNGYRSYYNYYEAPGYYTFPGYGYYGGGLGIGFGFGGRPALGQ